MQCIARVSNQKSRPAILLRESHCAGRKACALTVKTVKSVGCMAARRVDSTKRRRLSNPSASDLKRACGKSKYGVAKPRTEKRHDKLIGSLGRLTQKSRGTGQRYTDNLVTDKSRKRVTSTTWQKALDEGNHVMSSGARMSFWHKHAGCRAHQVTRKSALLSANPIPSVANGTAAPAPLPSAS